MSVSYAVEINRIVWGDHAPKKVGVVTCEAENIRIIKEDGIERFRGNERMRVYSFTLWELADDGHRSCVVEMIAYGDQKKIEESIKEFWGHWLGRKNFSGEQV